MKNKVMCLCATVFLTAFAGCGIDRQYIRADRFTYEAIAPEYQEYVDQNKTLNSLEKSRRFLTIELWERRIQEAEANR